MEKTFILGKSESLEKLNCPIIKLPFFKNDIEIHDWIVQIFKNKKIDKIIIEIDDSPSTSLKIGYHIRLSIGFLREKVLIPILFISKTPLYEIIKNYQFSSILLTKGVYFSEFDIDTIQTEIHYLEGLNQSDYFTNFLKIIKIEPNEKIGRHSIANIWGAYILDKVSSSLALSEKSEYQKELYFKYLVSFNSLKNLQQINESNLSIQINKVDKIDAKNKKILLIDDEADKGWDLVLSKIFDLKDSKDFIIINEKIKDYESLSIESKKIIENENFDLFLVDLRLNGLEEDENLNSIEFSGMKVMKKIKSFNNGNQVMMFTASNKTWNLKSLIDEGADAYYLKESPEFHFSFDLSKQNYQRFKEDVKACFYRAKFLKEFFTINQVIINQFKLNREFIRIDNEDDFELHFTKFQLDIINQLNLSYILLEKTNLKERKESESFQNLINHSFISLYKILEYIFDEKVKNKIEIKYFDIKKRKFIKFEKGNSKIRCGLLTFITSELKFEPFQYYNKLEAFGKLRNDISHPGKKEPNIDNCLDLLRSIKKILLDDLFFKKK